jgi:hypothetical protein
MMNIGSGWQNSKYYELITDYKINKIQILNQREDYRLDNRDVQGAFCKSDGVDPPVKLDLGCRSGNGQHRTKRWENRGVENNLPVVAAIAGGKNSPACMEKGLQTIAERSEGTGRKSGRWRAP